MDQIHLSSDEDHDFLESCTSANNLLHEMLNARNKLSNITNNKQTVVKSNHVVAVVDNSCVHLTDRRERAIA